MARQWLRRTAARGAALVVAAGFLVTAHAPAQAAPSPSSPDSVLAWTDCEDGFECATAMVPMDYRNPSGQQISLAVVRLPASDPTQRIGTIFLNPGGPGGSGVDFTRAVARALFPPEILARFDIAGFDPRGVGQSTPVQCFPNTTEQAEFFADQPVFPFTRQQEPSFIADQVVYSGLCGLRNGSLLRFVSTDNVARDMDRLRALVGDEKLTYVGYSYGTYLGAVYANLFPTRVRALVLDGVVDPVAYSGDGALTWRQSAAGTEHALDGFAEQCARAATRCAVSGGTPADVRARVLTILNDLKRAPVPAPGAVVPAEVDHSLALAATQIAMYDKFFWPQLAAGLAQAAQGDGSTLVNMLVSIGAIAPPSDEYDNGLDAFNAIFCSDSVVTRNPLRLPQLADLAARESPTFGRIWAWSLGACPTWPGVSPTRYAGPFDRHTSATVLLVGSTHDPATPLASAQRLRSIMPDSRLITHDGFGHVSIVDRSTCAENAVNSYLLTGTAPDTDLFCRANRLPFDGAPTTAAATALPASSQVPAGVLPMLMGGL